MKSNIYKLIIILFVNLFITNTYGVEQFNFDVTEVEITENGNKFVGYKRGKISTIDGVTIDADRFEYDKKSNILNAKGKVKIEDKVNNYIIYTENITYLKNQEFIFTKKNSKAISSIDNIVIDADDFEYDRNLNVITAKNNVAIKDDLKDFKLYSNFITYNKNEEKILTKGKTSGLVNSKYNIDSSDMILFRNSMELISNKNTIIKDKSNLYNLSKFKFLIQNDELRGQKITIITNFDLPKSDTFYFKSANINLGNNNFIASETKIKIHKDIFDNSDNDPRLYGASSKKNGEITIVNKGVFTSCRENDDCPPWVIQSNEIKHDKSKKQLIYKNALLKVYNIPVFYLPKFFHPDPTVKRQSGILKPVLNDSDILGSSFTIPYYHVISEDSDITSTPTLFDDNTKMIQNEYRKIGKNYNFKANFGHTRDYDNTQLNKKKNISYLFSEYNSDLNLQNFKSSKMSLKIEKVTNDTYLKVFESNFLENSTALKPSNSDSMRSELKFVLNNENYNISTGFLATENLHKINSDRYQYVLPYYDFNTNLFPDFKIGSISLNSNGSNELSNTNNLKSEIINNLSFSSLDFISMSGIKTNYNINLKNLNSLGKNVENYKNSPQVELTSIYEINSSYPLKKSTIKSTNFLTPKISFRINPGDMKNHSAAHRTINIDNIFSVNRLGFGDSFETGRSITLGLDYKRELLNNMNKYFEVKLASVIRDKEESYLPKKTTLNKKTSNIFGSISNNYSKYLNIEYNFALDNNLDELEYNEINTSLSVNNLVTTFNYIKESGEMGDENFIKNTTSYKIDDQNYLRFNTRRNRKLNLTEFYDLVYEYKNDCLTAGIKYKKTYYEDRDLKPTEDLLFTVTLFPLTVYEHKVDKVPKF